MPGNKLSIELQVSADGLVEGLKLAGKSVDGAAQQFRQSFGNSAEATSSFTGALRDFKSEATQASRVANFYARDLAEIVPGAGGATSAIRGLISAVVSGGGFAAAFEVALVVIKAINDALQEEKRIATEVRNVHIDTAREIKNALNAIDESLDKNITRVQRFKSEFAKGTREQSDAAKKAAAEAIQDGGGVVDFVKYMWGVFKDGPEHAIPPAFKAVDDAFRAVIERSKEFDAQGKQIHSEGVREKRAHLDVLALKLYEETLKENEAIEQDIFIRAKKRIDEEIRTMHLRDQAAKFVQEAGAKIAAENEKNREERMKRLSDLEQQQLEKSVREWGRAAKQIGESFGQAFAGIASGTLSTAAAFKEMGHEIVKAVLDAAVKALEAYALSAEGAAFFSQAGIPVIGPILAIGAAASAGAFMEGLIASLPSAAVGMPYVPRDMPVNVHEGERILTKQENQAYGRGSGGGGGGIHVHIHGAIDGASVQRVVESEGFRKALREARRNGMIW